MKGLRVVHREWRECNKPSCIWGLTYRRFPAPVTRHWTTGSFAMWSSTPVKTIWLKIYNELLFPAGTKAPLYSLTHSHCCTRWLHPPGIGICWQHWGKSFQTSLLHKANNFLVLCCSLQKVKKRYCHLCYRPSKYLDYIRGVADKPTSSLLTIRFPCRQEISKIILTTKVAWIQTKLSTSVVAKQYLGLRYA